MLMRKAKRAMLMNKKAYLSCIFLIAVGILMQTALSIAVAGLEGSTLGFYRTNRLADTYAAVESMPAGYVDALRNIEGIAEAQVRYVAQLQAEVPGSAETITLRLVATDPEEPNPLNTLSVTGNANPGLQEMLVNPAFLTAHGLQQGDVISIFSQGKEYEFLLTGTAISPEYIYITRDATQILPDEAGFGIGYITTGSMELLTGRQDTANSILFQREAGVSFDDVKLALEDALRRFGLMELYDQEDLLSYFYLDMEISSIHAMATAVPMVFLILAAVVLYLMLKRVIEQERTQIGTLKAFGYSNRQLIGHYLTYGAVTGMAGGALGWILGYWASGVYLDLFLQFFMLPKLSSGFDLFGMLRSLAMAVGSGLLGAYMGARKIIRLQPAEAMRPESPKAVRFDIVKRAGVLGRLLTSRGRMSVRGIARNPVRSLFVVLSIMFSFGIISFVGSFDGLIDKMIFGQLEDIQRYQVKLTLAQPLEYRTLVEAAYSLDSVTYAEGLLEIPMELSHRHLKEGAVVTGVEADSLLYQVVDTNTGQVFPPPEDSVILSNGLAEQLRVQAGDWVTLSSPLLPEDVSVPVSRVIEQNLGGGCYLQLSFLSGLMQQPKTATSLLLNTDHLGALKESVKHSSMIITVEDKESTLKGYRAMMGMFSSLYTALQGLGTLVAFAIIYNTTTISLSERKREYATLRVLGLAVNEVSEIMSFEYSILTCFGILLGIPFTQALNGAINLLVDTSLFSMPSTLSPEAYLSGIVCCVAAMFLASRSARKKIRAFDMVEVLKERE